MGAVYVLTVTTSMQIMNLEAPSMVVSCQGPTVEELVEEDLAKGCPCVNHRFPFYWKNHVHNSC